MESQITMFISLVTTSGVLTLFLCLYAWLRRAEIPGAYIFVLYTLSLSIYTFAYAFELASTNLQQIKFWILIEYIGLPFAAPLGLLIVLRYLGTIVSRTQAAALFIIPTITLIMVATNDYHQLFYKTMKLKEEYNVPIVQVEISYWYIVHGAYTFGLLLVGFFLLLSRWNKTNKAYKLQLLTLICSELLPMITAFIYLMGLSPFGIDPVPIVVCITSAMYIWALLSTRMLTVIPIAKESLFDSMEEGVLVLGPTELLIDYNPAVSRMLPALQTTMIGKPLDEVWIELTGSAFPHTGRLDGIHEEMMWTSNDSVRHYQLRTSVIKHRNGHQAGSLLMLIDVSEQKQLQKQLERLAFYDGLTQISNRNQFIISSRAMLKSARYEGSPVSIILFDIDFFKHVNDTYGHEVGDRLIVNVVSICRRYITPSMLFARYGGEEFIIALPSATAHEANKLAEQLRSTIESEPLPHDNCTINLTCSFGVAQTIADVYSLELLLRNADAALYESKRNGRNKVSLYTA